MIICTQFFKICLFCIFLYKYIDLNIIKYYWCTMNDPVNCFSLLIKCTIKQIKYLDFPPEQLRLATFLSVI